MMNKEQLIQFVDDRWNNSIIPILTDYIKIPNKSPAYDTNWEKNGYMEQALQLVSRWCKAQNLNNFSLEIHREQGRTPLLAIEIAGQIDKTAILYGHLDKQPEMTGWDADLGPWKPVIKNNRLYGRGGADDGYAVFAALTAIAALQQQNLPYPRCIILIECSEESGSTDLSLYIQKLKTQIGTPDLVICLDSSCADYERLWCTTSLRGIMSGILKVKVLNQGIHSGVGTGIVPSSFRILRQLLNRIENEKTGQILLPELSVDIPQECITATKMLAKINGDKIWQELPFAGNTKPLTHDLEELLLNKAWHAGLEITGIRGIPDISGAGNVFRPETACKLSIRLPPTCDPQRAAHAVKDALEKDPPYGAEVTFTIEDAAKGWYAKAISSELSQIINAASDAYFGSSYCSFGEGGTIPFLGMLSAQFPQAQFVVTGVLGPFSNAHGPNEFLHIPTAKKVTCCVAEILQKTYSARKNHGQ